MIRSLFKNRANTITFRSSRTAGKEPRPSSVSLPRSAGWIRFSGRGRSRTWFGLSPRFPRRSFWSGKSDVQADAKKIEPALICERLWKELGIGKIIKQNRSPREPFSHEGVGVASSWARGLTSTNPMSWIKSVRPFTGNATARNLVGCGRGQTTALLTRTSSKSSTVKKPFGLARV